MVDRFLRLGVVLLVLVLSLSAEVSSDFFKSGGPMGTPASTPILPQNLGKPIQLQKVCAAMAAYNDPVLRKIKAAKNPKRLVYVNWTSVLIMAGNIGNSGCVRRNS